MAGAEWRTFSVRVNSSTRKAVGVQFQCRWPLSEEEWNMLISELELMKLGLGRAAVEPVSVSARSLERLQAGQVTE